VSEQISRLWHALAALPLLAQAGLAAGALLLILGVSGTVGGWIQHRADRRFDAAEAERATEREREQAITDDAIRRAEAAEARASEVEAEVAAARAALGELARRQGVADTKVQEAVDETAREITRAGTLDADAARADVRARLRRLGLLR
jgi:hypothetical protein